MPDIPSHIRTFSFFGATIQTNKINNLQLTNTISTQEAHPKYPETGFTTDTKEKYNENKERDEEKKKKNKNLRSKQYQDPANIHLSG